MYKVAFASLILLCSFTYFNKNAVDTAETNTVTETSITSFLKEFAKDRECTKLNFSGNLFSFKNDKGDVDSEIEVFQLYIFNEDDPITKLDQKSISTMIKNTDLELLNQIRSKDSKIDVYVKDNNDVIEDVFLIVVTEDSGIIFHANGKIRYEDLKKLNIDFDGAEDAFDF